MGKNHSKANNNKELYEIIDKKLKMKNVSIDKKIEYHYNKIVNSHTVLKTQSPMNFQKRNKLASESKEDNFMRWHRMVYKEINILNIWTNTVNKPLFAKSLYKFPSIGINSPLNSKSFKNCFGEEKSKEGTNYIVSQFNRTQSTNFLNEMDKKIVNNNKRTSADNSQFKPDPVIKILKPNQSQFDLNSNQNKKASVSVEKGLRDYYQKHKEKFLERIQLGPPELFRWIAWIISIGIPENRESSQYFSLVHSIMDKEIELQIKKDLHRTLSEDNLFLVDNAKNALFRLLKAYAVFDAELSYCQGMNFIAGYLLMISEFNEVECFFMLKSLFSKEISTKFGVRGFFLNEFPMLRFYMYQFSHIFQKFLPNLKSHFDKLEVPDELWVGKWYQALYTNSLKFESVCRIWDCLIIKGLNFIHNFTISLLQSLEKDLLLCEDLGDISEIFHSINPYNESKLNKKRVINIEEILSNALKIDIPNHLLNKVRYKYEKINKFDLALFQQISDDVSNSASFSVNFYDDLSCNEFSVTESKNISFCNNVPKTTKNAEMKTFPYDPNFEHLKSTFLNSNTNKVEEELASDVEEKHFNETSICSEVDLFEKTRIQNQINSYIMTTKIITRTNKNPQKIKLTRTLNK